jgi:hypothetical protein
MESQIALRAKYSGPLLKPVKRIPQPISLPVSAQIEPSASHEQTVESHGETPSKSGKRTEMILIGCGILLLLVNIVGTWVSFGAANAAKDMANEANRLTRLLVRGTSAAHIVTKPVLPDVRPDSRLIRIAFRNDGKVNALNVEGSATVCFLSFPAEEKLGCKTIPVSKSQLGFQGDEINLGFDGLVGDGAITMLESNRATLQYSSKLHFNDGFDDWIDESSCQLYYVRHFPITDRVQERNWANCDVARNILGAEVKRRAAEE